MANSCLPPVNQCVSEAINDFKKCFEILEIKNDTKNEVTNQVDVSLSKIESNFVDLEPEKLIFDHPSSFRPSPTTEEILNYCYTILSANLATVFQFESAKIISNLINSIPMEFSEYLTSISDWNSKSSKTDTNNMKSLAYEITNRKKLVVYRRSQENYETFVQSLHMVPTLKFIVNNYIELRTELDCVDKNLGQKSKKFLQVQSSH